MRSNNERKEKELKREEEKGKDNSGMTNKIYITYDNNETVTYSFWKQFFLMSGVWVIGNEIENTKKHNLEAIKTECLHLYFLSKQNLPVIKDSRIKDNVFYFTNVKNCGSNALYKSRKDILPYDWKKKDTFINALDKITFKKKENYSNLLETYIGNSLWLSTWLYFELAYEGLTEWDTWILNNSKTSIGDLKNYLDKLEKKVKVKKSNSWNYKFMYLYCKYLETAIENRNPEERKEKVEELFKDANKLSLEYGWQPALCELCALIADLSPLKNKIAVLYYKEIPEYERNPEMLYKLGKVYEKKYGDIEKAIKYYELADETKTHYRARYQIGSYYEKRGAWKKAIIFYESIFEQLKNKTGKHLYNSTTTYDFEYYEKIMIKIRDIFRQKVAYKGKELDELIDELKEKKVEYSHLEKMIHCMGKMSDTEKTEKEREHDFLENIMEYVQKRIDLYYLK